MEKAKVDFNDIIRRMVVLSTRIEDIGNRCIFRPLGLTSSSYKILSIAARGEAITPSKVSEQTGGKLSNISQRISFLERKGFLKRSVSALQADKRCVFLRLTPEGKRIYELSSGKMAQSSALIGKYFKDEETGKLLEMFDRVKDIVDKYEDDLPRLLKD